MRGRGGEEGNYEIVSSCCCCRERRGGGGGAAAGLQRYPLGALRKLRYLDIGHRGNEQYLILSFSLFYLDMCMQIMSAIFIIILDIPGCV